MATGGRELLEDPLAQALLASKVPARLAYSWTDGSPRVVPIWFHWDEEEVVFASFISSPKAKAITDGDPLAVTVDTDDFPHQVLILRGPASVRIVDGIVDEYAAAARRYFGDEQGAAWIDGIPDGATMVRIGLRPEHVTILDFQSRFPSALSE